MRSKVGEGGKHPDYLYNLVCNNLRKCAFKNIIKEENGSL